MKKRIRKPNLPYHREWARQKRINDPTHCMFHNAKRRAKAKGVEFNIEPSDIFIPEFCPVFGTSIHFRGKRNDAPSLDRVDPLEGYIKNNIRVISNKANSLKNNASIEELEKILNYMKSHASSN